MFTKLKALLCKAGKRTIPAVEKKIGGLFEAIKPQECPNFFNHAEYA
ncbi:hypothetical protein [Beijerinckia mobilis]|nr:hypothetical protein [Beijerinckia mobilis]